MMFYLRNSWRMLQRDWRSGELNILVLGLIIAVTSITSVGFFTDRVEKGLQRNAAELLAADLVIASPENTLARYRIKAQQQGLRTATTAQFRSVVLANGKPQLTEVKAVSGAYPLRGHLQVSDSLAGPEQDAEGIPEPGTMWVEPRLLQQLGVSVGDSIQLGARQFRISRLIRYEPDRGGDFFSLAPRVMLNREDLQSTQLIQVGSLVNYRLLIAGKPAAVAAFADTIKPTLAKGEQLLSVEKGRPELSVALERAQRFLGLAAMISVLLAGVAVATVAYRFADRHLDTSALYLSLGVKQSRILTLFTLEMVWLALLASSLACMLGLATQYGISSILDKLFLTRLPAPGWQPVMLGYATGFLLLLGFAMPPLFALKNVPPLRVLRRSIRVKQVKGWQFYVLVLVVMGFLLYWQVQDARLVLYLMLGMFATLLMLALAAYALIQLLNRGRGHGGVAWRFGLANIVRRPATSVIQVVAFGTGIMILLLLSTVRSDLLNEWQHSLPPEAPNAFMINIQSDQVKPLENYLRQQGIKDAHLYPMVRARLVRINQRPVDASSYTGERAKHLITREFNLSWADQPQKDNQVIEGQWWRSSDQGKPLLSLEQGIGETLGIHMGDRLGFDINGDLQTFTVSNIRKVDWDSFNVNFFTLVPPGVLEKQPASWITSIYLDPQQKQFLGDMIKHFPNVTVIDVAALMNKVRSVMDRVAAAVQLIFIFTLLAGLAVLYAAIQANLDERRYESAILRTLGARRKILLQGLVAEFVTLGALAGVLAGVAATGIAWLLANKIFQMNYVININILYIGLAMGVLVVGVAGVAGTLRVLRQPPLATLRQTA